MERKVPLGPKVQLEKLAHLAPQALLELKVPLDKLAMLVL